MSERPVSRVWTEPHLRARSEQVFSQLAGTSPEQLPRVLNDLLAFHQYALIIRVLDAVEVGETSDALSLDNKQLQSALRSMAVLGNAIINLNLQDILDFADVDLIDSELESALRSLCWPDQSITQDRGPLHDLVPTYRLLLEVIEILVVRGEVAMALSVLHLIAEYLPLLAWQSTLGHAGDPTIFSAQLLAPTTRWNDETCPLNRQERHAFAAVSKALESDSKWDTYLRDSHSRVASALLVCGGVPEPATAHSGQRICRNPCSVMTGTSELSWKTVLIRRFKDSSIMSLRHDAPVGHFFSVPSETEILSKWETTWEGLLSHRDEAPQSRNPLAKVSRTGALPGLYEFLGLVADVTGPLEPSNVLGIVADHMRNLTAQIKV